MIFVEIIVCVLIADLVSGFFHWLEDAYGREHWPITGNLITKPNILHHHDPAYFTRHSWLKSADLLLVIGAVVLISASLLNCLTWQVALVVGIGVNANEIHKWTHRTEHQNGRLVSFFQRHGMLQSQNHHSQHHRGEKNTHYCVVTNHLNPVLEKIAVWSILE